jgi:hypothetical protein
MMQANDKELVLTQIDFASPEEAVKKTIPVPNDRPFEIFGAIPSPTGEWIVLPFQSSEGGRLQLYNVVSGATQDVVDGGFPVRDTNNIADQRIVWSLDGTKLTFLATIAEDDDSITNGVFVYSVETRELVKIIEDSTFYSRMAWSNDSKLLAISRRECSTVESCQFSLVVIEVDTKTTMQNVSIPFLNFGNASFIGIDTICSLAWSPDNQYISFVSVCSYEPSSDPKEIYVWNVGTSELVALTTLTSTIQIPADGMFSVGFYDNAWIAPDELLVGGVWGTNNSVQGQTFTIKLPDKTQTKLFSEIVEDWEVSPNTQKIAYRTVDAVSADQLKSNTATLSIGDIGSDLRFANVATSVVNACRLSWSPDSTMLAYTIQTDFDNFGHTCDLRTSGIGLVDSFTKQSITYTFTEDEQNKGVIPIGWVRIQ